MSPSISGIITSRRMASGCGICWAIATFLPMLQIIGTNINSAQSGWTTVAALAAGLGMGVVAQQFVQWYERANHDVQLLDDGQSNSKAL